MTTIKRLVAGLLFALPINAYALRQGDPVDITTNNAAQLGFKINFFVSPELHGTTSVSRICLSMTIRDDFRYQTAELEVLPKDGLLFKVPLGPFGGGAEHEWAAEFLLRSSLISDASITFDNMLINAQPFRIKLKDWMSRSEAYPSGVSRSDTRK